ncbi:hypothetical protein MNEG_11887 [Monoraphidium neglectum]|uniref:Uncharacterized protein n=1 Tax=Monoraphidium neglectum TaxID=145388 RepID=A0A0D2LXB7_9CHLO|nr:hypothetical protein MNEG_11887 [Monoraphidium neglectum]KIY96074.1 hypothetical protein MNEG_11887 [Monoraphidium neglectum]|eukprot:XP_013895094.1 hypothetical protein MNEG_11887 [Monoraphidium neglectum]
MEELWFSRDEVAAAVAVLRRGGGSSGEAGGGIGGRGAAARMLLAAGGKRRGRKGRVNLDFGMQAVTPAPRVQPAWVPQLQLHMLCTGCLTALLVSRTAENGLRVFRVWRDDSYLWGLVAILTTLMTHHVAAGKAPTGSQFASMAGQSELLSRTCELAKRAVVIAEPGCGAGGEAAPVTGAGGLKIRIVGEASAGPGAAALVPPPCPDGSNTSAFWV